MLDFRIYTFLEVCKYMNFTKAAEALHITLYRRILSDKALYVSGQKAGSDRGRRISAPRLYDFEP